MLSSKKRDQKNDHFWAYSGWEALEKAMSSSNSRLSIMVNQPALFSKSSLHPNSLIEPATAAAARGYAVIKREMQLTDNEANPSILRDIGFSTLVCLAVSRHSTEDKRSEHLKLILDGLKWRLQMQERFALVWQEMVKHGLLSMECVMRRIDLGAATGSDTVLALINTIERFEYVQDPGNGPRSRSERIPKDSLTNNIAKAVGWLETSQYFSPMLEDDPLDDVKNADYVDYSIRAWATLTAKRYEDVFNAYVDMCGAGSLEMDPCFAAIMQEFSQSVPREYEAVLEISREGM
ncbi:hypothetical protein GGP41_001813 [Bipolaris sorokiniana]|uniref:Uncharacterized protein n=1 Tax=Cochliobolus sativus TaxID=45130 RepID=A0A8H5ZQF5_COCSA|nr:hypothetical protein GGP41_001813 [Bipolaris sorokiniana]